MPALVAPIVADRADFVVGSRRIGEYEKESTARDAGITVYTRLINLLGGTDVTDIANGYRAIRASRLVEISFTEDQFHNPELLLGAARAGLRVARRPGDDPAAVGRRDEEGDQPALRARLPAGDAQDVAAMTDRSPAEPASAAATGPDGPAVADRPPGALDLYRALGDALTGPFRRPRVAIPLEIGLLVAWFVDPVGDPGGRPAVRGVGGRGRRA